MLLCTTDLGHFAWNKLDDDVYTKSYFHIVDRCSLVVYIPVTMKQIQTTKPHKNSKTVETYRPARRNPEGENVEF